MQISVVIPAYNRSALLARTLKSILSQKERVDEIVVVDDGSLEDLSEIAREFGARYIKKEHGGVSSARNVGIESSKNEWIAFLDSDDVWLDDKISKQIEFHKKNRDILFSHTNEIWIRDGKEIKQKSHHKKLESSDFLRAISGTLISPSTTLVHKDIFREVGYFDEHLKSCEDYDLWLRVVYRFEIGFLSDFLAIKYGHDNQLSKKYHSMDLDRVAALKKHINSKYSSEVKKEIERRVKIVELGASKRSYA